MLATSTSTTAENGYKPNTRTGQETLKLPSSLMGHSLGHLLSTARGFVNAVPVFSVEMEDQL